MRRALLWRALCLALAVLGAPGCSGRGVDELGVAAPGPSGLAPAPLHAESNGSEPMPVLGRKKPVVSKPAPTAPSVPAAPTEPEL